MKKKICVVLAVVLAFSMLIMSGCDDENNNTKSEPKPTNATSETKETKETKPQKTKTNGEIQEYLEGFYKGDNNVYGAWKVKDFDYMTIVFRNDNLAELVMGNEGHFSKYSINKSEKTLGVQLMPGVIDGIYSYKYSDNNQKLTLTLDGKELILIKQKNFTLLPKAPKNPKIDKKLLGWWENENGMYYCFQDNGVMYENSISMETCYTYTVSNGKIAAEYNYGGKMTDDFTYSFKNGQLILDDLKCKRKKMQ